MGLSSFKFVKQTITIFIINLTTIWAQQGSITGIVTDAKSGESLIAANVTASSPVLETLTGSATDIDGRYYIPNLPQGEYTLKVNYIGYESLEKIVNLGESENITFNFELEPQAIQFETYVVTASRRRERIEDAPAAISVITQQEIRRESNTNLGDYLKSVKGVDFTQSGIDSYNLSARGFNSSFSSRLLTLTDGRMANVPSLRLIAYNTIPVSSEDVKQFEVVLGPSSALYGPNAHSGVLNIVTNTPRESVGTKLNIQMGSLAQPGDKPYRKLSFRHASAWRDFGFKISAIAFEAYDWKHFNDQEYEGHDPAFLGRPHLTKDHIDNGGQTAELFSPRFTLDMILQLMPGEIPGNGIDDNGNGFIDENESWSNNGGIAYADGIYNWSFVLGVEENSPQITQEMIDAASSDPFNRYWVPGTDVVLWGVTDENLGKLFSDGVDNNGDGFIDEGIDSGIDGLDELYWDGIDNDGDGIIDEDDEINANQWLARFESDHGYDISDSLDPSIYGFGFGDYKYDSQGNIVFDTNEDGIYGGKEDFKMNYGDALTRWNKDANDDGIDDFPDFNVKNYRYDFRFDYDPNQDFILSLSSGYAWARNINITGLARYLADGWIYRYYQTRLRYKNIFFQAYLNTSYSGDPSHPTRSLSTGDPIIDRSKKFSAQFQHTLEFLNDNLRFVWGMDYFLTMPDTRGTILSDNQMFDNIDNNGNGEAGSPFSFADANDNYLYNTGEKYNTWASTTPNNPGGTPTDTLYVKGDGTVIWDDNVFRAIVDGIDNDGDGLIDEGIDEKKEDNRYVVNELGSYYQLNWKLSRKWELIQATRFDAHDRLTDFVNFNNQQDYNYSPFKWKFDFNKSDGLQVSPKLGIVYRPAENQNIRLTWAKAFSTPSNQALFLDIFVTRVATLRVYARGADKGYIFPRDTTGQIYWKSPYEAFKVNVMDTSKYVFFYLSTDPRVDGYFKNKVVDVIGLDAEIVRTWEVGYKGQINKSLFGTLDLFTSHYNSFVSPITFISPIVINKSALETDYNDNGITNRIEDVIQQIIADKEDYDESFDHIRSNLAGVAALDTTPGFNPPIVVGYLNYGEVDLYGLDMSLTKFISRDFILGINYSFISITDFLNPITGGKDPINAPRNKGGVKLSYAPHNMDYSVTLNYRYVDSFPWSSGIFFGNINSYNIFDLHATYTLNKYLSAMLSVNNIFNDRHVEIIGGPTLGRSIIFRLQATL